MGTCYFYLFFGSWSDFQFSGRNNCIGSFTGPLKSTSSNQRVTRVIQTTRPILITGRAYMLCLKGATIDRQVCLIPNCSPTVPIHIYKGATIDHHNPFT